MRTIGLAVAVLLGCLGPAPAALAQRLAVAPSGPAIAVAVRTQRGWGWEIWTARDGLHFTRELETDRWVHAVEWGQDGALYVLDGAVPREGLLRLTRYASGAATDIDIAGTHAVSAAHLRVVGRHVAVLDARGAHLSRDAGRTFRAALPFDEGYGFYAASFRMDRRGRLDVLAPDFNTCGSSDHLESLSAYRVGGGGQLPLPTFGEVGFSVPLVGPDRVLLVARERSEANRCSLVRYRRDRPTELLTFGEDVRCWMVGQSTVDETALVMGGRVVVRVDRSGATVLGELPDGGRVHAVVPYRGGALVMESSGRLRLMRDGGEQAELWSGPPAPAP